MHVKLGFVFVLYLYHVKCHQIFKQLQNDEVKYTTNFMRLWNEGATIILFAVVFLVVLKNAVNWIYGVIGIFLFSVLIMLGFKFYKRIQRKKSILICSKRLQNINAFVANQDFPFDDRIDINGFRFIGFHFNHSI